MKKFIELWFKSEDIAVQFSQTSFYDIIAKIIKTIVLFIVCLLGLCYLIISEIVNFIISKSREVKPKEEPPLPPTEPYNTQYTDMGIPKEVPKKGDNLSESDYKNLRKML